MTCRALAGRTAVVTGAGRGIGRAVAVELAALGARTIVVGRARDRLSSTNEAIEEAGGECVPLEGDVRSTALLSALAEVAPEVDVLVNNAASYAPFAVAEDLDDDAFDEVHRTVVDGSRRMAQSVLPGMKRRGFGRIVSIGSLSADLGGAGQAAYTTAKAALVGLTRTLAVESAPFGVTVNVVLPGLIGTERVEEGVGPSMRDRIVARIPAGRVGTPEEVAHVVACLVVPRAGYVTGAVVPVGGGLGLGLVPGTRT